MHNLEPIRNILLLLLVLTADAGHQHQLYDCDTSHPLTKWSFGVVEE